MIRKTLSLVMIACASAAWFAPCAVAQSDPPGDPTGIWILSVNVINGEACQACNITLTLPAPDDGSFPAAASGSSNVNGPTDFGYGSWSKTGAGSVAFRFTEATVGGGFTTVSGTLLQNSTQSVTGVGSGTFETSTGATIPYSFTAARVIDPARIPLLPRTSSGGSAVNGRLLRNPVQRNPQANPIPDDFAGNWVITLGADADAVCDGCLILLHADAAAPGESGGTLLVDAPFAGSTAATGLWTRDRGGDFEIVVDGLALTSGGLPAGLRHFAGKFRIDNSDPRQPTAAGSGTLVIEPGDIRMSFSAKANKLDTFTQF